MAKNVIKQNSATTIAIATAGDHWVVSQPVIIRTEGMSVHGIHETSAASENRIDINGVVSTNGSGAFALLSQGLESDLRIGKSGVLSNTTTAVRVEGDGSTLVNRGRISAVNEGISLVGENQVLTNEGSVGAVSAVKVMGGFNTVINEKGGILSGFGSTGTTAGVAVLLSAPGETTRIVNRGEISGVHYAVYGEVGDETVVNLGTLTGLVILGDGADRFDNRGGTLVGTADGGLGDDVYLIDDADTDIREFLNSGTDTVRSSVSYDLDSNFEQLVLIGGKNLKGGGNELANAIHGNSGNNVLRGQAGNDDLLAGKGKDRLFGGTEADLFHFATGDGKDTIMDFENGIDRIGVGRWKAIRDAQDLIDNHARDTSKGLLIEAGSDSLLIRNFTKAELDATDLSFAL